MKHSAFYFFSSTQKNQKTQIRKFPEKKNQYRESHFYNKLPVFNRAEIFTFAWNFTNFAIHFAK